MQLESELSHSAPVGASSRVDYIDGIRGWAALCVLLFHVFWESLGARFPEIRSPWTAGLLNGPLAVYVFFILSGDALSTPFLAGIAGSGTATLQKTVLYRYFRLTVPIVLSCLLSYVLLAAGLNFNQQAGAIVLRTDWLGAFLNFPAEFAKMAKYALYGVYTDHKAATSYNPFLWTMSIELVGSMLVFCFLFVVPRLRRPLLAAMLITVFLAANKSFFALFFLGVSLALVRRAGCLQACDSMPVRIASWSVLAAYLMLHARSVDITHHSLGAILEASALTVALYVNTPAMRWMSRPVSTFLGRVSFPLYLVHFAVIVSPLSWAIVQLNGMNRLNLINALAIGAAAVALSFFVAYVFMHVEQRMHRLLRRQILHIDVPAGSSAVQDRSWELLGR